MSHLAAIKSRFKLSFRQWTEREASIKPLHYFRILFGVIWLIYDLFDLSYGLSAKLSWIFTMPLHQPMVTALLVVLVICELGVVCGLWVTPCLWAAVVARALEAYYFPVNDYLYFCVTAVILTQINFNRDWSKPVRVWPRDVLLFQTAWIYAASAFLKMNPHYWSGGDLFVRLNYTAAVLPLPYFDFYRHWISEPFFSASLARFSIVMEFLIPLLLVVWFLEKKRSRILALFIFLAVFGIHGFAMYGLNVYFFGLSLIAQVSCLLFHENSKF